MEGMVAPDVAVEEESEEAAMEIAGTTWTWEEPVLTIVRGSKRKLSDEEDDQPEGEGGANRVVKELPERFKKYYRLEEPDFDEITEVAEAEGESLEICCRQSSACARLPPFTSVADFENHYVDAHMNACSQCKRILSTPRLLHLHLQEVHDSFFIALANTKDSYECTVEGCMRKFTGPFQRREHLIKKHKFPIEFEFERVILGAEPWRSKVRRSEITERNARETTPSSSDIATEVTVDNTDVDARRRRKAQGKKNKKKTESTSISGEDMSTTPIPTPASASGSASTSASASSSMDVDDLVKSMTSLNLVPRQIRFGRSTTNTGFSPSTQPRKSLELDKPTILTANPSASNSTPSASVMRPTTTQTPEKPPLIGGMAGSRKPISHKHGPITKAGVWTYEHIQRVYRDRIPELSKTKEKQFKDQGKAMAYARRKAKRAAARAAAGMDVDGSVVGDDDDMVSEGTVEMDV
ncbi:hypothetical protein HDU97_007197 [Phlyctochytrium planicorne]|nr:hypothetical protein HDU97_007197 [Phlyctochytrium planicorne]